jgi:hypothetical protein
MRLAAIALAVALGCADASVAPPRNVTSAEGNPVVFSILPSAGPTTGGTIVVLRGEGFTSDMAVTFAHVPAAAVSVKGSTVIEAVTPASVPALVMVRLTRLARPPISAGTFTYFVEDGECCGGWDY